jgi:hypothetical protein
LAFVAARGAGAFGVVRFSAKFITPERFPQKTFAVQRCPDKLREGIAERRIHAK